jgi:hypothetical protein
MLSNTSVFARFALATGVAALAAGAPPWAGDALALDFSISAAVTIDGFPEAISINATSTPVDATTDDWDGTIVFPIPPIPPGYERPPIKPIPDTQGLMDPERLFTVVGDGVTADIEIGKGGLFGQLTQVTTRVGANDFTEAFTGTLTTAGQLPMVMPFHWAPKASLWNTDGTVLQTSVLRGPVMGGGKPRIPATYQGTFTATAPADPLPVIYVGKVTFNSLDAMTGVYESTYITKVHAGPTGVPSADELKCQINTSKALGKLIRGRTKCTSKCDKGAVAGKHPASDCIPPYAGTTLTCADKADAKFTAAVAKACPGDCPEGYEDGCTEYGLDLLAGASGAVDAEHDTVYCSPAAPGPETTCRQTIGAQRGSLAAARLKCLAQCHQAEFKLGGSGACVEPAPTDLKTIGCLSKARAKADAKIAKKCMPAPACVLAQLPRLVDEAEDIAKVYDALVVVGD